MIVENYIFHTDRYIFCRDQNIETNVSLLTRENIDTYSYRGITIESRKQELSMDRDGSIKTNGGDTLAALISNEMMKMITRKVDGAL